uniref:Uncharacterized protein n=1 Tax=Paenarthrobacter aurescens TaxID=43663 RepID=Q6SK91_PAEAU|nr:hypothetical protein [Paenarthrobacter aurescens]
MQQTGRGRENPKGRYLEQAEARRTTIAWVQVVNALAPVRAVGTRTNLGLWNIYGYWLLPRESG